MAQSLCPGYKHVREFSDPQLYEEEEEVEYVVLDFGTQMEAGLLASSRGYRLIGLDSEQPFIQLRGSVFAGNVSSALGSELLFTANPKYQVSPSQSTNYPPQSRSQFEAFAVASQHVAFRQITLESKYQAPNSQNLLQSGPTTQDGPSS